MKSRLFLPSFPTSRKVTLTSRYLDTYLLLAAVQAWRCECNWYWVLEPPWQPSQVDCLHVGKGTNDSYIQGKWQARLAREALVWQETFGSTRAPSFVSNGAMFRWCGCSPACPGCPSPYSEHSSGLDSRLWTTVILNKEKGWPILVSCLPSSSAHTLCTIATACIPSFSSKHIPLFLTTKPHKHQDAFLYSDPRCPPGLSSVGLCCQRKPLHQHEPCRHCWQDR